ncbi:MAG: hypothetical protein KKA79_03315 [Nanoarchaeota archaeon]|nr:hypothetical protein [Nanoarchaeota archaeon]MCG2717817.1 hypothetical protein [Nanoarchaeota archaeon]
MVSNISVNEKRGLNVVAATIDQTCEYDISNTHDICEDDEPTDYPPGHPDHAAKGACCPDIWGLNYGGSEASPVIIPDELQQQYCHDDNQTYPPDAHCTGDACKCYLYKAEPEEGDRIGVADCAGGGCGSTGSLACKGIYYPTLGVCAEGYFFSVNENAYIRPQVSVFVKEKLDWILTEKGDMIPIRITITLW